MIYAFDMNKHDTIILHGKSMWGVCTNYWVWFWCFNRLVVFRKFANLQFSEFIPPFHEYLLIPMWIVMKWERYKIREPIISHSKINTAANFKWNASKSMMSVAFNCDNVYWKANHWVWKGLILILVVFKKFANLLFSEFVSHKIINIYSSVHGWETGSTDMREVKIFTVHHKRHTKRKDLDGVTWSYDRKGS